MSDFFTPWRRKMGVVTLIVALPLMGMWVRSYVVEDKLAITIGDVRYAIGSVQGCVVRDRWLDKTHSGGIGYSSEWRDLNRPARLPPPYYRAPPGSPLGQVEFESKAVPYWPFVVPLSLLSACLLLSQPRTRSNPQNVVKPAATEGT